jgi:hypothetical protein
MLRVFTKRYAPPSEGQLAISLVLPQSVAECVSRYSS